MRLKAKVPASTANLGPGFDIFGLALDIYNLFEVEEASKLEIRIEGEGRGELEDPQRNLVLAGIRRIFERAGRELPPLRLSCRNEIPLRRGLGSSASAAVGGVMLGNKLCGELFSEEELLEIAAEMEGHPDNVAAALFGGLQIAGRGERGFFHLDIPFPSELRVVLFIPNFEIPTQEARRALPEEISLRDAVFNASRTALLVGALLRRRFDLLREATRDLLHQPHREGLMPYMRELFEEALRAGALGAFLSGAGPSVGAFAGEGEALEVAKALRRRASELEIAGEVRIARASRGAQIFEARA